MTIKSAILIDGGFLRVAARKANKRCDPDFIEKFAHACKSIDEQISRILYYDCAPFSGTLTLPVSGTLSKSSCKRTWLHELSYKDLFAVRRGQLKFRGYVRKKTPRHTPGTATTTTMPLTDDDFKPEFEQKGVDMRIGLDVAAYSANRAVDRIILISADTDCIPALKYGRKAGLQTVLIEPFGNKLTNELLAHADFKRMVALP
jgi:uncharacterized LabA/DUF88 family protein